MPDNENGSWTAIEIRRRALPAAQCIMFPDQNGNIVCLFFTDSGDPVKCFQRCQQMMQEYLNANDT